MILTNIQEKIKYLEDLPRDIFLGCVLLLLLAGAFMLGRISMFEEERKAQLRITSSDSLAVAPSLDVSLGVAAVAAASPVSQIGEGKGAYVGSKTGKTYHLPWCSGAKRIKEENKRWFVSKNEAENAGYRPAANCKGI